MGAGEPSVTEAEALELAIKFLEAEGAGDAVLRRAQRLDYETSQLFQYLPDRMRRRGHCWMFSFEFEHEEAEDELTSGGWFPVVVDEGTRKVFGNDAFIEFLLESHDDREQG